MSKLRKAQPKSSKSPRKSSGPPDAGTAERSLQAQQAFWSYVHQDDADEGGRIAQLAKLLAARVRFLTGAPLTIFYDQTDIGWGDDWRARLDQELLSTTFFIPVVTASYF